MDDNQSDASSEQGRRPQLQYLDVELQFGPPNSFERELVQRLQSPVLCFNRSNEIVLAPIVAHFKALGYPLENSMISYYSQIVGVYVYCGNDPLPVTISVPLFEVKNGKVSTMQLVLKCREAVRNEFGTVITIGIPASLSMKQYEDASQPPKASRRTKERKIGYIIEKVSKWRQLYSGASGPEGSTVKYTLEEAASQVGISKKSLDDYLLQLRYDIR